VKNLITTIPARHDLRHWHDVEPRLRECVDEESFWTFSCTHFPKHAGPGAACFIVHSGFVRGWFTVLDFTTDPCYRTGTSDAVEAEWKEGPKVTLVTWRPLAVPLPMTGFQGWRYTDLQP
jgi:hypothetical protein